MAKRTIACRVCGKQFVPCNKSSASLGAFNYHSIACSPECGAEYLRRIQESRKQPEQNKTSELAEQISIDEIADVDVANEISESEAKEAFESVVKSISHFQKRRQETND